MLHQWRIEQREYARQEARRGGRHGFEALDPHRTALVVVDMVAFFVEENPYAKSIVPNINTLASAIRTTGGRVAWVLPAPSSTAALREFYGDHIAAIYLDSGGDGPLPSRRGSGLTPDADDIFVGKSAASAFFPGTCALSTQLDQRSVDTVMVAGTVANVCCESTARDASTLGYRTIMVADANAAVRDEDLNATLHTIYRSFGDVRATADLVLLLS